MLRGAAHAARQAVAAGFPLLEVHPADESAARIVRRRSGPTGADGTRFLNRGPLHAQTSMRAEAERQRWA
ncbi:hypothetical protein QM517_18090, partial [Rhodococcus sp. IEGM 1404]|nr:hypothetical protein [Microbacterium sp. IEGM 1404]